jgi:hypothetical protein
VRFKLDENIPADISYPIADAGHDVATIADEGLSGSEDESLYDVCRAEQRTLVTLDMDFANPLRFPPEATAGIIVLRPPRPLLSLLHSALTNLLTAIETEGVAGSLWIAEPTGIRVYEPGPAAE